MKKKKIEEIPQLQASKRKTDKLYKAAVGIVSIDDEKVLLMDIYRSEHIEKAILRVALAEKDYGNYDFVTRKWDCKKIDKRHITGYLEALMDERILVKKEDNEKILDYVMKTLPSYYHSSAQYPLYMIAKYQEILNDKKAERVRENRRIALKVRCENIPKIPNEYTKWIKKEVLDAYHYMFYERKGKKVNICCSKCKKSYSFRTGYTTGAFEETIEPWGIVPRHNYRGRCEKCDTLAIYKSAGKQNYTENTVHTYIIQKYSDGTNNGIVVRYFENYKKCDSSIESSSEEITNTEICRAFFVEGRKPQLDFNKHNPYTGRDFWDDCNLYGMSNIEIKTGVIYPESYEVIKDSEFKYCGMEQYELDFGYDFFNPIEYLITYKNAPALEMFIKLGMKNITTEMIATRGYPGYMDSSGKKGNEILQIKKTDFKEFVESGGDKRLLKVLQFECKAKITLNSNERDKLSLLEPNYISLHNILPYVSVQQFINRVEKYAGTEISDDLCGSAFGNLRHISNTYIDYLVMKQLLGYDMTNSVYLYPRNLEEEHNKLVIQQNVNLNREKIEKAMEKYPDIKKSYKKLYKIYSYKTDEYVIRPAKDAGEIINEGSTLHHCVGGDNYLSSHNKQKSIILFLRHKKSKHIPFVTIEIEGAKIKQWYGKHNKKTNEEEKIKELLEKYTDQLKEAINKDMEEKYYEISKN